MVQREIQSVEVSCFIQATEDEDRVTGNIRMSLGIDQAPEEETLDGHFGNRILRVRWHLTGEDGWRCFGAFVSLLGKEGRGALLGDLSGHIDEHRALYVRLNKQALMAGRGEIADSDPVRVRVKPRSFMIRGDIQDFYAGLLKGGG
ncbi:MAG: hypothetical protein OK456_07725 [Thaumarchaeota archaeon]|nr:hypothetical protein [Nitrososphaerota archaeon]